MRTSHRRSALPYLLRGLSLEDGFELLREMVLSGLCAAALGAAGLTLHRRNVRLALAVAQALRCCSTLADVLRWHGIPLACLNRYRILGDPLAPLIGNPHALEKAQRVFAPAPDDVLPILPSSHPSILPSLHPFH